MSGRVAKMLRRQATEIAATSGIDPASFLYRASQKGVYKHLKRLYYEPNRAAGGFNQ